MAEYLFLFRGGDASGIRQSPEAWQLHMQKWMQWMGAITEQGKFLSAQPLDQSGKQVLGDKKIVTDGPFIEGKEMVGGYLMCTAASYAEAVEMAKNCPILEFEDGKVEIRQINSLAM